MGKSAFYAPEIGFTSTINKDWPNLRPGSPTLREIMTVNYTVICKMIFF